MTKTWNYPILFVPIVFTEGAVKSTSKTTLKRM